MFVVLKYVGYISGEIGGEGTGGGASCETLYAGIDATDRGDGMGTIGMS